MILSYTDIDKKNYQYAFDSYDSAFKFLMQILKKNGNHSSSIAYGKEGKGIYRHNICLFAYGDDQCSELLGLTKITISSDEVVDYDDEIVDYNEQDNYEDDDDEEPVYDDDVYYDNDTRL